MKRIPPARLLALMLPWLIAAAAAGQELDVRALTPVEPTVEDTGPLSLSLRELQIDLRGPVGFEHIYRVPGYENDLFMRVDGAIYAVFPQSVYASSRSGLVPLIPHGTIFYIGSESMNTLTALNESTAALREDRSGLRIDSRIVVERDVPNEADVAAPEGNPMVGPVAAETRPGAPPPPARYAPPLARYAPPSRIVRVHPLDAGVDDQPATKAKTIATDATYRAERLRELIRRAAQADEDSAD